MERNMASQRPCNGCRRTECDGMECGRWQIWFLESWAAVNHYAWAQMDELGRQEPRYFYYDQPHMLKSPCHSCKCSQWCDRPCSLRIKWWDARIGKIRKKGSL